MTQQGPVCRRLAAVASAALFVAGCRIEEADVHRWANTQQGPRKILAVMTHDKYLPPLRLEAAMTLTTMQPRSGRKVGLEKLLEGLQQLSKTKRDALVGAMLPRLMAGMRKAPPPIGPDGRRASDPSIPFKDATLALLSQEGEWVSEGAARKELREALTDWAIADFAGRMNDSSQSYGMGQLLRHVGPEGLSRLPALIRPDAPTIDSIAEFIAELGDKRTRRAAGEQLVAVAKDIDSEAWRQRATPGLKKANQASGLKVEGARFSQQLDQYQEEELLRILSTLKKVGGEPIASYLLGYARDKSHPDKRRAAALAAMEGHVNRKSESQVEALLSLAGANDTPDAVREQALRRVGELPRAQTAEALFRLFKSNNWKIRWVAAELVLKTSEAKHLGEFMTKLAGASGMSITEPIRYGKLMGELRGTPAVADQVVALLARSNALPVRLSALGYFLEYGKSKDLELLLPLKKDQSPIPGCRRDAKDCEWRCEVMENGHRAVKAIATVADFARYCVEPAISSRAGATATVSEGNTSTTPSPGQ